MRLSKRTNPELSATKDGVESNHFQAKRSRLHDSEESHGGGHGTEMGWLVSYADMMTLLVGLFVLLFTLAKQGGGKLDTTMKKVSAEYFNTPAQPIVTTTKSQTEKIPLQIKQPQTVNEPRKPSSAEPEKTSETISKLLAATTKIEEIKKKADTEKKQLTVKIEKLEKKITELTASFSSGSQPIDTLKEQVEAQQKQIEELKQEANSHGQTNQRYVVIMVSWETEKHDLDLIVTSPSHKNFNFKKRSFDGEPGHFEIDSRYGPGIEMWKAENFTPGNYRVRISFYSNNGNYLPAKAKFSVVTNSQTYKSESVILKDVGGYADFEVELNELGNLKVLP